MKATKTKKISAGLLLLVITTAFTVSTSSAHASEVTGRLSTGAVTSDDMIAPSNQNSESNGADNKVSGVLAANVTSSSGTQSSGGSSSSVGGTLTAGVGGTNNSSGSIISGSVVGGSVAGGSITGGSIGTGSYAGGIVGSSGSEGNGGVAAYDNNESADYPSSDYLSDGSYAYNYPLQDQSGYSVAGYTGESAQADSTSTDSTASSTVSSDVSPDESGLTASVAGSGLSPMEYGLLAILGIIVLLCLIAYALNRWWNASHRKG